MFGGRGETVEFSFKGFKVSVWDDEEVLEMEGGDGCTAL